MIPDKPIIVYGTTWCPDCRRAKQFFGEHRVQYTWVDIEQDDAAMAEVERINEGKRVVPTIICRQRGCAGRAEQRRVGRQARAARHRSTCLLRPDHRRCGAGRPDHGHLHRGEGLNTLILEKSAAGGQVANTQFLENYPGFDQGISGAEFAERLTNQARRFGVELLQATAVEDIGRDGRYLRVKTSAGNEYGARAVLIATGSRYRRLNVPGERELIGAAIHFCATCDGPFYRGKDVVVVGGGNSGFQEGLFLQQYARNVTIVEFLPEVRASRVLQQKVAEQPNMSVVPNHAIQAFRAERGKLQGVEVLDRATGEAKVWHPDGVFIFVGLSPNSDFLPAEIQRDRFGFVITGPTLDTTMPGAFAAGDVRAGSTKQAASAAGEGATAAIMIREYLHGQ